MSEQTAYEAGQRVERERALDLIWENAREAKDLWIEAKGDTAIEEYWRGQMNGLHYIIGELERGDHE